MVKHIKISILQFQEKHDKLEFYFPFKTLLHYEDQDRFETFDSWAKKDQEWKAFIKLLKYMDIEVKKPKEPLVNELLLMDILSNHGYEVITVMKDEIEHSDIEKKQTITSIYFRKRVEL